MKTETKHTPTPEPLLLPAGRCNNCMWYWNNDEDPTICPSCKTDEYLMDMPEIVRAVNAHEELLNAMAYAINHLEAMQGNDNIPVSQETLNMCRKARAKAEDK